MSQAARVDDPIAHIRAMAGLLCALAVGARGSAWRIQAHGLVAVASVGALTAQAAANGRPFASRFVCNSSAGCIQQGSANVYINGKPAARAHLDKATCSEHESKLRAIAQGSAGVYINGQPAARVGDRTTCKAKICAGSHNVFIGAGTRTTEVINPKVPRWLENAVRVVTAGSAHGSGAAGITVAMPVGPGSGPGTLLAGRVIPPTSKQSRR
jgi:uncharacterized Zn-binding protein involved in type VI secretion